MKSIYGLDLDGEKKDVIEGEAANDTTDTDNESKECLICLD